MAFPFSRSAFLLVDVLGARGWTLPRIAARSPSSLPHVSLISPLVLGSGRGWGRRVRSARQRASAEVAAAKKWSESPFRLSTYNALWAFSRSLPPSAPRDRSRARLYPRRLATGRNRSRRACHMCLSARRRDFFFVSGKRADKGWRWAARELIRHDSSSAVRAGAFSSRMRDRLSSSPTSHLPTPPRCPRGVQPSQLDSRAR
jgi:hypothetical protein